MRGHVICEITHASIIQLQLEHPASIIHTLHLGSMGACVRVLLVLPKEVERERGIIACMRELAARGRWGVAQLLRVVVRMGVLCRLVGVGR